jgi:hypothetical protein
MRRLSLLLFAVLALAAPGQAVASTCLLGPFVLTTDVAVGCDLVALHQTSFAWTPVVTATRYGQSVDVTGTIDRSEVSIEVEYDQLGCNGEVEIRDYRMEPYDRFQITLVDARAGDVLYISGHPAGTVQADGTCVVADLPAPFCAGMPPGCPEPDPEPEPDTCHSCVETTGCNPGGLAALSLALLALVRRRLR